MRDAGVNRANYFAQSAQASKNLVSMEVDEGGPGLPHCRMTKEMEDGEAEAAYWFGWRLETWLRVQAS